MLLQRIFSGARVGAAGIHPERNVLVSAKRGNRTLLATKGDEITTPLKVLYSTIFVVGSLIGPGYFLLEYKRLKLKRDASK